MPLAVACRRRQATGWAWLAMPARSSRVNGLGVLGSVAESLSRVMTTLNPRAASSERSLKARLRVTSFSEMESVIREPLSTPP